MPSYYFGLSLGEDDTKVVVSSSTTGKDVEVVINTSTITSVQNLYIVLEKIEKRLITKGKTWS